MSYFNIKLFQLFIYEDECVDTLLVHILQHLEDSYNYLKYMAYVCTFESLKLDVVNWNACLLNNHAKNIGRKKKMCY